MIELTLVAILLAFALGLWIGTRSMTDAARKDMEIFSKEVTQLFGEILSEIEKQLDPEIWQEVELKLGAKLEQFEVADR